MPPTGSEVDDGIEIPPLRSLEDFIYTSARFQLPDLRDPEKWPRRMTQNLLYYQTNYFSIGIAFFFLMGIFNPQKMIMGIIATVMFGALLYFMTNSSPSIRNFNRYHPMASLGVILACVYMIFRLVDGIPIFLLGILVPVLFTMCHASCRTRNLKNKIYNRIEQVGLVRSPMGFFLDALGQELDPSKGF
ncbi:unnamed protein product [Cyprideis torosa]|uniref:PRA1 family protein n=1 Tax=Cyprideis torosa TaxID=163714 RepID=A0A7R8WD71_9CRUS|nr:unnamed protein product [Cyprideis torosa]CAG0888679.1 unnamed protein product [Cyprideis torosa]